MFSTSFCFEKCFSYFSQQRPLSLNSASFLTFAFALNVVGMGVLHTTIQFCGFKSNQLDSDHDFNFQGFSVLENNNESSDTHWMWIVLTLDCPKVTLIVFFKHYYLFLQAKLSCSSSIAFLTMTMKRPTVSGLFSFFYGKLNKICCSEKAAWNT